MSSVLFYGNPVAINRDQHATVKIGSVPDFSFAAQTNSVPLTGIEFVEACKEYPIVFASVGDKKIPVLLIGLRDNENLFVTADGKWDARYVPAFVRRYPFVLAEKGGDEFVVCVDEASSAYNNLAGQALFDEQGQNTPFLEGALGFLNAFQAQFKRTQEFVAKLEKLELLTEMAAKTELADGRQFLFNGLYVVDENKFIQLKANQQADLVKSGEAGWVFAHLISLSNMSRLVDQISQRS